MTDAPLRAFALKNFSDARAMLEAARSNYSDARSLLRRVAPDEYRATQSLTKVCARPGHTPASARAKRAELVESLVVKNWSLRRTPDQNLERAHDESRHLGLWAPNSDGLYSMRMAATRLGLMRWDYESRQYLHTRSGLGAPTAA